MTTPLTRDDKPKSKKHTPVRGEGWGKYEHHRFRIGLIAEGFWPGTKFRKGIYTRTKLYLLRKMNVSNNQLTILKTQTAQSNEIVDAEMFHLIDSILPFEACLYHQVLPLSIKGDRLHLGMVDKSDTVALEYLTRMISYRNCSVVSQEISTQTHQAMLSAYLKHSSKKQSTPSLAQPAAQRNPRLQQFTGEEGPEEATLIIDNPKKLESGREPERKNTYQGTPETAGTKAIDNLQSDWQPLVAVRHQALPRLEVRASYLSSPVEAIATLPPPELLQELLGRVLIGGIGRLYFERHKDRGRILWSLNGVLQSVLESIPPSVFQGVIDELKRLTRIRLLPVKKQTQVEIERLYQQTRLLLRLRVMPGNHGEEATLQVLRGAALKFYQQQQLSSLGKDALTIAKQLQQKLNEIHDRADANPSLGMELESLPALHQIVRNLNQQVQDLTALVKQC